MSKRVVASPSTKDMHNVQLTAQNMMTSRNECANEGGGEAESQPLLLPDAHSYSATVPGSAGPPDPAHWVRTLNTISFVLCVGLGGFLFGYDTGMISGALPYIREDLPEVADSLWVEQLVVSATVGAAALGAATGGWLSDSFGRRTVLLSSDVLFVSGALVMAGSESAAVLIVGRFLIGLGVGAASIVAPVFIAEGSPTGIRASLVAFEVLLITFGQFMAYLVNYSLQNVGGQWRWMLGVSGVPAGLQLVLLVLLVKESPHWVAQRDSAGGEAEALRISSRLQPLTPALRADLHAAATAAAVADACPHSSIGLLRRLFVHPLPHQLTLGVGLQVYQQLAGINTVMYYSTNILLMAGFAKEKALLWAMVPAACNMVGSVVGIVAIDRYGRRPLLLTSAAAVTVALLAMGAALYSSVPSYAVAALVAYMLSFSPGLGPVPWAVNTEIYPPDLRGLASGVATTANWVSNVIVSQSFLSLATAVGPLVTFGIYAFITTIGALLFYRYLPETKGLSLEEVQAHFTADTDQPQGGGSSHAAWSGNGRTGGQESTQQEQDANYVAIKDVVHVPVRRRGL